ncbi:MAG: AraC family transcriptional regulator [Pseudomonadota bacterium]
MLDLLSDIFAKLSVQGTLYFRTSFSAPYGVQVPQYENVARFHYAHRGSCWLSVAGREQAIFLDQGDLVIVPHGASHCLMSRRFPPEDALPLDTVLEQASYDGKGVLVFGGEGQPDGGGGTQLICGHFSFAPGGRHLIFDLLPDHLHIARYGETAGPWLSETLKMIGAEIEQGLPGSDLIAMRLAETILAHTLRIYLQNATAKGGPLIGFADPHIGRALAAMHADPTRAWTVELLAREAGLSRSGFANRFSAMLGITPMDYLKRWRMQIARALLATQGASVAEAAEQAGYRSEAAFSRAFKSETGYAPSAYRSLQRKR